MGSPDAPVLPRVGPVLVPGPVTDAIVRAIREATRGVEVASRGSYLRVSAPGRLSFEPARVADDLGRPFRVPSDLERVMPSFAGRLRVSDDLVEWTA